MRFFLKYTRGLEILCVNFTILAVTFGLAMLVTALPISVCVVIATGTCGCVWRRITLAYNAVTRLVDKAVVAPAVKVAQMR